MHEGRPVRILIAITLMIVLLAACCWCSSALAAGASLPSGNDSATGTGPGVAWTKTFGGAGYDVGNCIRMTADGGYIIAGSTRSFGSQGLNVYLIKTTADGTEQWERTLGGASDDEAFAVVTTSDGGYAIAGYTRSQGAGGSDVCLIKTDANGAVQWEKTYGSEQDDAGYALLELSDGYLIAGYTGSSTMGGTDGYLVRTDASGNLLWSNTYGGTGDDRFYSLCPSADGGYLAAGQSDSFSDAPGAYLVKVDAQGTQRIQEDYGMMYASRATTVMTRGDQVLVNGWEIRPEGASLSMIIANADGIMDHSVSYSRPGEGDWLYARSMIDAGNGGLAIAGLDSVQSGNRIFVTETDGNLKPLWMKVIGTSGNDTANSIVRRPDGDKDYVLTGLTAGNGGTDVVLIRLGQKAQAPVTGTPAPTAPVSGQTTLTPGPATPAHGAPEETATPAQADIVKPVAAVIVGAGLGFCGVFFGRFSDIFASLWTKIMALLRDAWALLNKIVPIDTLFDFVWGYVKSYAKSLFFRAEAKVEEASATQRPPFFAGFSRVELWIVVLASVLLGVAFLICKKMDLLSPGSLVLYIVIAGFVTLLHDLTHRYVAWRYNAVTEFKFWGFGTLIMLATAALFGVAYGCPARTLINDTGRMSIKEQAIVFLAGPGVSFLMAAGFLVLVPLGGDLRTIGLLGASMNLLTAVYSPMPFDPMDGNKVLKWKSVLWAAIFVPMLLLYIGLNVYVF